MPLGKEGNCNILTLTPTVEIVVDIRFSNMKLVKVCYLTFNCFVSLNTNTRNSPTVHKWLMRHIFQLNFSSQNEKLLLNREMNLKQKVIMILPDTNCFTCFSKVLDFIKQHRSCEGLVTV